MARRTSVPGVRVSVQGPSESGMCCLVLGLGRSGKVEYGTLGTAWQAGRGPARMGQAVFGSARQARYGRASLGAVWWGLARQARLGTARRVLARLGSVRQAWLGRVRLGVGTAWQAGRGRAWLGVAVHVRARQARHVWARWVRLGKARQAGNGLVGAARSARHGWVWQARQGPFGLGGACRGRAWQARSVSKRGLRGDSHPVAREKLS